MASCSIIDAMLKLNGTGIVVISEYYCVVMYAHDCCSMFEYVLSCGICGAIFVQIWHHI